MTPILSVENALNWSWGLHLNDLLKVIKDKYRFVRIVRTPKVKIGDGLIEYFPATLLQNCDNLYLIKKHLRKVAVRMGGMVLDSKHRATRYDTILAKAGAVIGTNKQLHDIAMNVNGNSWLIPNGVDLELFRPNPNPVERKFTIGFAGNTIGMGGNYKGWRYYGQALVNMMIEVDHIECLHNGPASQKQIGHEEMCEGFYWKIDALILPSKGEGCSNVTGEALACGVPVITTKVGYHGEMLEDGKNVLFCERDADDICDKIRMLMNDADLRSRISKNARAFAEAHQDIKVIAHEYDRVLRSVIKQNGA